jgi:membrane-associated phospholipid phosphatase
MLRHYFCAKLNKDRRTGSISGRTRLRRWEIESLETRQLLSGAVDSVTHASGAAAHPKNHGATVEAHPIVLNATVSPNAKPMSVTAALAKASNPSGNGVVTTFGFQLTGKTAPGARILAMVNGRVHGSARANSHGNYDLSMTSMPGLIPVKVVALNASGQSASTTITVMRGDDIIAWNETAIEAGRKDMTLVGQIARNFAMVSAAVYDAVNAIEPMGSSYHADITAPRGASVQAAASEAAYTVLLGLYPSLKPLFDATLDQTLGTIPNSPSKAKGRNVGILAGNDILAWRANDGSSVMMTYTPGTAPGQWRPTPPDYGTAIDPMWGHVTPFAIPSAKQFLPPPPPAMDSPEYAAAVKQVESLGAANSTTRTPEETQIGLFWQYDTLGFGPPPVFFSQIANQIALERNNTFAQNARMFALVNVAMADAGIVAWDAKYIYNLWRPVTAIQNANQDGNPATKADPTWMPLGTSSNGNGPNFTPAFPSYVSGHATFGGALFQSLADFYGTNNVQFSLTSDELPGVTRTYTSFSQAAQENAMSRIYLGIHYIFDATEGIATGDSIGNYVFGHDFGPTS